MKAKAKGLLPLAFVFVPLQPACCSMAAFAAVRVSSERAQERDGAALRGAMSWM
jgi:hypothetical protein